MVCSKCNSKTRVIDTIATDITSIRRRKCLSCGCSFYTEEITYDNDNELRRVFNEIKNGRYERKPESNEERKLRLIKRMMEG